MGRKKMSMIDFIRKNPNMSAQEILLKRGGNIGTIRTQLHKVRKELGMPPGKRGRPAGKKITVSEAAIVKANKTAVNSMIRVTMAIRHLKRALEYLNGNARVEG